MVLEPEYSSLGVDGLSFHFARLTTSDRTLMPTQGIALASAFREMGADAVAYACAETSFLNGVDANQTLIEELQLAAGLPAITATAAMVAALRHLGARTVGLVTPYTEERGRVMEAFLQRCGFEVVSSRHQTFREGTDDSREWHQTNLQPPWVAYRLARQLTLDGADALLISGTNLRTFEVIQALELDSQRPVVTSNTAIAWWFMRTLGVASSPSGLGRLFAA